MVETNLWWKAPSNKDYKVLYTTTLSVSDESKTSRRLSSAENNYEPPHLCSHLLTWDIIVSIFQGIANIGLLSLTLTLILTLTVTLTLTLMLTLTQNNSLTIAHLKVNTTP